MSIATSVQDNGGPSNNEPPSRPPAEGVTASRRSYDANGHSDDPFPVLDLTDDLLHSVLKKLQELPNVNDSVTWEFERRRCQPHVTADVGRLCFSSPSMLLKILASEMPPFAIWGKTRDAIVWLSKRRAEIFHLTCKHQKCYFDVNLGTNEKMDESLKALADAALYVRSIRVRVPAMAIDLLSGFPELTELVLLKCGGLLEDAHLEMFAAQLPKLLRLTVDLECNHDGRLPGPGEGPVLTDRGVGALGRIPALEELSLSMHPDPYSVDPKSRGTLLDPLPAATPAGPSRFIELQAVTSEGLRQMLTPLTNLTFLELRFFKNVDDDVLSAIARCTRLTYLDLADCPSVGAPGCEALARTLVRLEHLNVSLWGEWTVPVQREGAAILTHLGKLPRLMRLDSSGISVMMNSERLSALAPRASTLQHLNLTHAEIIGDMLNPLAPLTGLRSLAVISSAREDMHNELDLSCLQGMKNLEQFELGGIDSIVPASRRFLSELSNLKVLALSFISVELAEELFLNDLTELRALRSLSLETIPIYDAACAALASATTLVRLVIVDCPIGDRAVEYIVQLPQLAMLILERVEVSDIGLLALSRLPSLEYLEFRLLRNFGMHSLEHFHGLKKLYYIGVEMRQVDACEHVDEIIESFRAENVTVEVDFTEAPRPSHQYDPPLEGPVHGALLLHPEDFGVGVTQGWEVPPGGAGLSLEVQGPGGVTLVPVGAAEAALLAQLQLAVPQPGHPVHLTAQQYDDMIQMGLPLPPLQVVPGPPHLDDLLQELHLQGLLLHVQQPQGEGEGEAQELEGGSSGGSGGELEGGFVGGGDYDEVD